MKKIIVFVFVISLALILACGRSGEDKQTEQKEKSAFGDDSKKQPLVTFVELGSVNCISCKMMQPVMKEVEKDFKDKVKVVFYDVWKEEGQPFAKKYAIKLIPTQVFLDKDGKEFFRHEGFFPKEDIDAVLKKQGVTK